MSRLGAGAMSTSAQGNNILTPEFELSEQTLAAAQFKLPEIVEASVLDEHNQGFMNEPSMITPICGVRAGLDNLYVNANFSIVEMMQKHSSVIGRRTQPASKSSNTTPVQPPREQALAMDKEESKDCRQ